MELTSAAGHDRRAWRAVTVDDLKAAGEFALATGPFGSAIGERFFLATGVPVIRGSNLSDDGRTHLIDDGFVFLSAEKALGFRRSTVARGDLVFTCWGTISQVGLISDRAMYPQYIISNKQMKLTPDPSKADSLFLFYLFSGEAFQRQIHVHSIGTSVPGFNLGRLRAIRFAVPELVEQRAIAGALSDVDALLGALDRLIARKRDLKQATMQKLLTGLIRLPGFSGEWESVNMAQRSTLKARIGWQGLTTSEYLPTGSYRLVTGTDFLAGRIVWESCPFVAADRYEQDRNIQLHSNDVLVTKDGTIGKVAFVENLPGPATLNSGVFVIRPRGGTYDPRFLYYTLASAVFKGFLAKLAAGSTVSHLYQKDFVSFEFLAPPTVQEQEAIAEAISDMDGEIEALEARRAKTRDLKQAMMQELLTGRTRLV